MVGLTRSAQLRRVAVLAGGIVGFAALTAVAAQWRFYLPFTPVPVTLQTAVVLLAGATLGPAAGAGSQALYLLAGATGLPMFTTGAVLGPTAGYLLAFLPAAALVGWARRRRSWWGMVAGMGAASLLILAVGTVGLCLINHLTLRQALLSGFLPFLPGDAIKLAVAAGAARLAIPAWERARRGQ